jgi:hypothetical protein
MHHEGIGHGRRVLAFIEQRTAELEVMSTAERLTRMEAE